VLKPYVVLWQNAGVVRRGEVAVSRREATAYVVQHVTAAARGGGAVCADVCKGVQRCALGRAVGRLEGTKGQVGRYSVWGLCAWWGVCVVLRPS